MGAGTGENGVHAQKGVRPPRPLYSSHFPLSRLLQLLVLLQTERYPNATRLAEICEVSRRTIYRDLATIADAGITVVYRPDRQGYELERSLFLQPFRIEDREAAALLVLCGRWGDCDDLGQGELADRAVGKLIQSLPEESRMRLLNAVEVLSTSTRGGRGASHQRCVNEAIFEAITLCKQIRLWFQEPGAEEVEATKFTIYRLAQLSGEWTLVGRSSRHCQVIAVSLGRITRAEVTDDDSTIPPRFDLQRFLSGRQTIELSGQRLSTDRDSLSIAPNGVSG